MKKIIRFVTSEKQRTSEKNDVSMKIQQISIFTANMKASNLTEIGQIAAQKYGNVKNDIGKWVNSIFRCSFFAFFGGVFIGICNNRKFDVHYLSAGIKKNIGIEKKLNSDVEICKRNDYAI